MQPLRGMGEKLRDISKANARTQKLSDSSDSGSQRSTQTALEKEMVNYSSTLTKNI